MKNLTHKFIIGTFVSLYLMVSIISTIHVIDFFELSNPYWLAVTLAIAFELGAAASLASIITLDKMNKTLIWSLFIVITLMQMQGNMYYAFKNITDYQTWSQLFNLIEEDPIYQKRILAFVSGAILPLVALGFIKSLVDYIKPTKELTLEEKEEIVETIIDNIEDWDGTLMDGLEGLEEDFEEVIESIEKSETDPAWEKEIKYSDDVINIPAPGLIKPHTTQNNIKPDTLKPDVPTW
jgi:hypothetical protein